MTNCDCSNNGIKAYFKLDYKPNKLSQLANDTHYVDINDVLDEINTHNTSETAHTYIQGRIDATNTTIGDLTELDTSVKTSVVDAINSEVSARGNADTALENDYNAKIGTLSDLDSSVKTDVVSAINSVISDEATIVGDLDDLDTSVKTSIVTAINSEVSDRQSADSGLQTQIDALAASSDVTDIVGTYAELQAYDTQHLNDNDIIKVLDDSTHNDAPSYYRYNKSTDSFTYIGSESASYTKAESDSLFVPQTRTVNSKALSADITLTSSDVGALASTTTINDLTTTAQQNALNSGATTTNIGQIATNTSSISTINGKIPSDASSSNKLVTASALSNAVVNLADKDLSNLTETGEERLHALKSYSDNGELLTDAEGLTDVTNYAHSTYDSSKFTALIHGTPTITADGLMYGNADNNVGSGLNMDTTLLVPNIKNEIKFRYTYQKANVSGHSQVLWLARFDSTGNNWGISADEAQRLGYQLNGTSATISADVFSFTENQTYDIGIVSDFATYFYIYIDGVKVYDAGTLSLALTACSMFRIGNNQSWQTTRYNVGAIDLKYLSVTNNGYVVFSGCKTGLDVIKPDDYANYVQGSLTVSTDGIASGFSNNPDTNLKITTVPTTNNYTVTGEFTTPASIDNRVPFSAGVTVSGALQILFSLRINTNNNQILLLARNSGGTTTTISNANITASGSTSYKYKVVVNGADCSFYIDDVLVGSINDFCELLPDFFIIGADRNNSLPFSGTSDLNIFKVEELGEVIYQPCLKIPYALSKTGSRVTNSAYRNRVNDMALQFGQANYYTLSDTDFTLPQIELYGLIGDKHLIDSYYNGLTYWELYSNRRLEQGGTCESGVEYTLPKAFADANYVLTIPYSSKTATTFIPSATGDFIAKGKGTL